MRYILIFVGASLVAYFLVIGIRAFVFQRNVRSQPKDSSNENSLDEQPLPEKTHPRNHTKYRIK